MPLVYDFEKLETLQPLPESEHIADIVLLASVHDVDSPFHEHVGGVLSILSRVAVIALL